MPEVLSQDEIDQLLSAISSGEVDTEEVAQSADQRKIKIYDFKRPDKFSKDQTRVIQMMHESFARLTTTALSAQLRSLVHVHVASVDQLTYEEFIRSIPNPTTLARIDMDPLKGEAILEIDPSITFTIIDRSFGGKGEGSKLSRELTSIENSVMESIIARIMGNLREAWSTVIDLRPRLGGIETNPQFAQIVPPTEMVVLVTLETRIGEVEGMMNFCIPYLTIQDIVPKLSQQIYYSSIRSGGTVENMAVLRDKISSILVPLTAEIGTIQVSFRDVVGLRSGDIIRLDNVRTTDPFLLKIGNMNKYLCRPGTVGNKLAVQIVRRIEDIETSEVEELAANVEEEL